MHRRAVTLLVTLLLGLQVADPASGSWSVSGSGTSRAAADTLAAPGAPSVVIGCGDYSTIAFRGALPNESNNNAFNINLARPIGTVAGDVLIAQVAQRSAATLSRPDSSWTPVQLHVSGTQLVQGTYWRLATDSDPAFWSWTSSSNSPMVGGIAAYSGVSAVTAVDASGGVGSIGGTKTAPSVAASLAGDHLLGLFAARQESPPAATGTTQRWSATGGNGSGGLGISLGDVVVSAAGATAPLHSSASGANMEWVGQTIALKPQGVPRATLTWTASPSAFATGYDVTRTTGGSPVVLPVTGRTTTSLLDKPLQKGTAYTWAVRSSVGSWRSASTSSAAGTTGYC